MTTEATPTTISLEPDWAGMRTWVLHVFKSDPTWAREMADAMGCEAPALPGDDEQPRHVQVRDDGQVM